MAASLRRQVADAVQAGEISVRTDPLASPTGFPFKVVDVANTLSDPSIYDARRRVCELGYLRDAYRDEEGRVRFRCASEPVRDYLAKGGRQEDTEGRQCLCNGLMAAAGMPQFQTDGSLEAAIVTSGDDLGGIRGLLAAGGGTYSARDVIDSLIRPTGT